MPTTPTYALPYPAQTDPADVPVDLQELAERVEAVLAGFVPGMVQIADSLLAAPAASFDFPGIPQTYSHLRLVLKARLSATVGIGIRFNGDAGAPSYDGQLMRFAGAAASGGDFINSPGYIYAAEVPNDTHAANRFGAFVFDIPAYTGADFKALTGHGFDPINSAVNNAVALAIGGVWKSNAAINRVTIFGPGGNLVARSRATLYGLR